MVNNNFLGMSLQHEASQTKIHFLDLNIKIREGSFITSTYFKSTDKVFFECTVFQDDGFL